MPSHGESFRPSSVQASAGSGRPAWGSARDAALARIAHEAPRFPNLGLGELDTAGLDARDAALAHAIYDAVCRRWLTIEFLLDARLPRPLRTQGAALRAALLAGAAQLLLLDRIPDHAAIHETVEWTKHRVGAGPAGLVNAVLRRIVQARAPAAAGTGAREIRARWTNARDEIPLPDGTALVLASPELPEDDLDRIAVATSHPAWLVRRWIGRFGWATATDLLAHDLAPAPTIINATLDRTLGDEAALHAGGPPAVALEPHERRGFFIVRASRAALVELLARRPQSWVQDPASAGSLEVARGLSPPPRLAVDLCAGQGTKTRQLAAMFPDAAIIATDTDPARLRVLRAQFASSRRVRVVDPCDLPGAAHACADLVLLDVPCSNSGVLARRVEARYRAGDAPLARLTALQRDILDAAIPLLAPGGRVVYATCSLEPEENEQQTAWFADRAGMRVVAELRTLPQGGPGRPPAISTDGAYAACLAPRR